MDYKDYYKVLGVARKASAKEIKAAYRRLARQHHPDLNKGSAEAERRFKEVNEAYEVLSDPEKRRRYDELGAHWDSVRGAPGGAWPGGGVRVDFGPFGGPGGTSGDFSEFFRTFFGGGFPGGGGVVSPDEDFFEEPADTEAEVQLSLAEVLRGATREVAPRPGEKRRVEVRIPPGVAEGSRVRVAGEGLKGPRGRRGDLYLRVRIRPEPGYERRGDDLHASVRVPVTTAVLGGEAEVQTLEGPVGIRIPAGSPAGQVFRLRGRGVPRLGGNGARGDLLATLVVEVPRQLTARQKKLFEELRATGV
jgi:curved DNA-binding protein